MKKTTIILLAFVLLACRSFAQSPISDSSKLYVAIGQELFKVPDSMYVYNKKKQSIKVRFYKQYDVDTLTWFWGTTLADGRVRIVRIKNNKLEFDSLTNKPK